MRFRVLAVSRRRMPGVPVNADKQLRREFDGLRLQIFENARAIIIGSAGFSSRGSYSTVTGEGFRSSVSVSLISRRIRSFIAVPIPVAEYIIQRRRPEWNGIFREKNVIFRHRALRDVSAAPALFARGEKSPPISLTVMNRGCGSPAGAENVDSGTRPAGTGFRTAVPKRKRIVRIGFFYGKSSRCAERALAKFSGTRMGLTLMVLPVSDDSRTTPGGAMPWSTFPAMLVPAAGKKVSRVPPAAE